MKKSKTWFFIIVFLIFGGVFGWYFLKQYFIAKFFANFVPPPQVISTATATNATWQPYLTTVGTVDSDNSVDISSEVAGQIKALFFKNGQNVKKGSPLIQLDDAAEQAQKAEIEAQLQLALSNLERTKNLFAQRFTTQSAFDDANSKAKQLKANLDNINASIAKKLIRAPFNGKIGISQVDLGQYVSAGLVCANLQALHVYNVKFFLPQQEVKNIALNEKIKVSVDAYPGEFFDGSVTAIDSKVDTNTRTIEVAATIDNSSNKLYPGMFVNVKLFLNPIPNTIVVPQTAVTYTLYGDSVFLVHLNEKKDEKNQFLGTVTRTFVRTGDKQENSVVILEGLKAGDIVVNSGQSKLEDGTTVAVNNSNPL